MKLLFISLCTIIFSNTVLAQFSGHTANTLNITGPNSVLKSEIPLAEPSVVGSTYLNDDWQQVDIVLKNGIVSEDLLVKLEIEHGNVEILYDNQVKFLDLKHVDFLYFHEGGVKNKAVISKGGIFTFKDAALKGVALVYDDGDYSIVKNYYIEFLQSNYNVALDVGSRDHRKIKRERLFISQQGKLILVKGSSKKIASQLGPDKEKALEIIKSNKLDLTDEPQLRLFIQLLKG